MITHLNMKSRHEVQNTPFNCTKLQYQKNMGYFQLSQPIYHKTTDILKTSILILKCCLLIQYFV
jgi:hypothetical protein